MTIVTKPISDKKPDKIEQPLVQNEINAALPFRPDAESSVGDAEPTLYVLRQKARRVSTATTICLFLTALLVMSIGVIGGVYLYRQFARAQQIYKGTCGVFYRPDDADVAFLQGTRARNDPLYVNQNDLKQNWRNDGSLYIREGIELDLETEKYEKIDVPDFTGGRRGRFVHDFNANKTGIIDMDGHRCFVMPLDRQRVLPPKSFHDLVKKMWTGYYEVDTNTVRRHMRVNPKPITDLAYVGYYIAHECNNVTIYRLEAMTNPVVKRSVDGPSPYMFIEFAGSKIQEFDIVNIAEIESNEMAAKAQ